MPHLTPLQWSLAIAAAVSMGLGKGGLMGLGFIHILIFAFLFGARDSTGIVLPMLLVGDVGAVTAFHQHARWKYIRRMLPPACTGVMVGAALMSRLNDAVFKPLIGWIVLVLAALQLLRMLRPQWLGEIPHSRAAAWAIGLAAGIATMLANAAGPMVALYGLAIGLPKFEFVGTNAWLFLILNAFKVPFSAGLGLIDGQTLLLNLMLAPAVIVGLLGGRWLTHRIPQTWFDGLLLAFAAVAALRLIGLL